MLSGRLPATPPQGSLPRLHWSTSHAPAPPPQARKVNSGAAVLNSPCTLGGGSRRISSRSSSAVMQIPSGWKLKQTGLEKCFLVICSWKLILTFEFLLLAWVGKCRTLSYAIPFSALLFSDPTVEKIRFQTLLSHLRDLNSLSVSRPSWPGSEQ